MSMRSVESTSTVDEDVSRDESTLDGEAVLSNPSGFISGTVSGKNCVSAAVRKVGTSTLLRSPRQSAIPPSARLDQSREGKTVGWALGCMGQQQNWAGPSSNSEGSRYTSLYIYV